MKKSELKNGMIVKTSGGRYGVVCLKDATDSNCIKFFYEPDLLIEHGSVERACRGHFIEPLDNFTDDLRVALTEEDAKNPEFEFWEAGTTLWSIDQVFSLKEEWHRK